MGPNLCDPRNQDFKDLSGLTELDLTANEMDFKDLSGLTELDLTANEIVACPHDLWDYRNVVSL